MASAREQLSRSRTRRLALSLIALTLGIIALVYAGKYAYSIFTQTPVQESVWKQMDAKDKATAVSQWRLMSVQAAAAAGATIALGLTALTYRLSRRGQFTERYTKALERLESKETYLRIGAIHALGHVSSDSPVHRENVTEVLSAFVAKKTVTRRAALPLSTLLSDQPRPRIASDVQAALDLLGRRRRPGHSVLDLRSLDLRDAVLEASHLERANLSGTLLHRAYLGEGRLEYAILVEAKLRYAKLNETRLAWADLSDARLQHASLTGARLQHAVLHETRLDQADLAGAQLCHAHLTGASLRGATLTGANFKEADLSGADLKGAIGVTARQLSHAHIDEHTTLPDHLVRAGSKVVEVMPAGHTGT
ncbi:pentapeptide repeat-containing protein [Streptomyces sp. NPDC006463]|uniref:pentapeptide repeat-containing protein n=1 Tax=Streptomyces sp. NPDC006463 TaxID=3364746 RepID=UPI0036ABF2CC